MYESTRQVHTSPVAEYGEGKTGLRRAFFRERVLIIRERVLGLMQRVKQPNGQSGEVEELISLICQGGRLEVKDGQLWVAPVEVARRFGDQIRRLKPEILLALGHCPKCGRELTVKIEEASSGH